MGWVVRRHITTAFLPTSIESGAEESSFTSIFILGLPIHSCWQNLQQPCRQQGERNKWKKTKLREQMSEKMAVTLKHDPAWDVRCAVNVGNCLRLQMLWRTRFVSSADLSASINIFLLSLCLLWSLSIAVIFFFWSLGLFFAVQLLFLALLHGLRHLCLFCSFGRLRVLWLCRGFISHTTCIKTSPLTRSQTFFSLTGLLLGLFLDHLGLRSSRPQVLSEIAEILITAEPSNQVYQKNSKDVNFINSLFEA